MFMPLWPFAEPAADLRPAASAYRARSYAGGNGSFALTSAARRRTVAVEGKPADRPALPRERGPVDMISDEGELKTLMLRSLDGDAAAYRLLLESMQTLLQRFFARRLAGDPARVEDLVQDTLLAIHDKRATFDPAQRFTAWAYALARYKLIDHYRRHRVRRHEPLEDERDLFTADTTDTAQEATIAQADLARLLSRLPQRQARAIALTKLDGLTAAEAAHRLGASEGAIKVSVHRGLKALRAYLGPDPELRK
jgi:RNA polymerase sigma-70 factor (ECF subfamily)